MAMYAVSTRGIIDSLHNNIPNVSQVWFADDIAVGGEIQQSLDALKQESRKNRTIRTES